MQDVFRIRLRHGFDIPSLPPHSLLNSGNRLFLFSGCITSAAGLLISLLLSSSRAAAAPTAKRSRSDASVSQNSVEVELLSPEAPLLRPGSGGPQRGPDSSSSSLGSLSGGDAPAPPLAPAPAPPPALEVVEEGPHHDSSSFLTNLRLILCSKGFWKFITVRLGSWLCSCEGCWSGWRVQGLAAGVTASKARLACRGDP